MTITAINKPHATYAGQNAWRANDKWFVRLVSAVGAPYPLYYSSDNGTTWATVDESGAPPSVASNVLWIVYGGGKYLRLRGDSLAYSATGVDGWAAIAESFGTFVPTGHEFVFGAGEWMSRPDWDGDTVTFKFAADLAGAWTLVDTGLTGSGLAPTWTGHFDGKWWLVRGDGTNIYVHTSTDKTTWVGGVVSALAGCSHFNSVDRLIFSDYSTKIVEWDSATDAWVTTTAAFPAVGDTINATGLHQGRPTFWCYTGEGFQFNDVAWVEIPGPASYDPESATDWLNVDLFADPYILHMGTTAAGPTAWLQEGILTSIEIGDSATIADALALAGAMTSTDGATASDAVDEDGYDPLFDSALADEDVEASSVGTVSTADSALAAEVVEAETAMLLADSATAGDAIEADATFTAGDSAAAGEAVEMSTTGALSVLDAAAAGDSAAAGGLELLGDSATAADAVETTVDMLLADSAVAGDAVEEAGAPDAALVADGAVAGDGTEITLASVVTVVDSAVAGDAVSYKDAGLVAWVMNTETGAASWYSNYGFLDVAQVAGATFAVGPEGLSVIGAGTDAGDTIDAGVTYGFNEFGGYDRDGRPKQDERRKRVDALWFGYTSDDVVEATVETYGQGEPVYTYSMQARSSEQPRNNRIQPGKGLSARYWRVGINNTGGCAFEVKSISADVLPSSRRL